jgi:hypothetical protein
LLLLLLLQQHQHCALQPQLCSETCTKHELNIWLVMLELTAIEIVLLR